MDNVSRKLRVVQMFLPESTFQQALCKVKKLSGKVKKRSDTVTNVATCDRLNEVNVS